MTFRARLVLAATGAVLVVVVLGSFVTYIVASNSLVGSADATLSAEADAVLTAQSVLRHPHRLRPAGGYLRAGGGTGRDHRSRCVQPGAARHPGGQSLGHQPGTGAAAVLLDHRCHRASVDVRQIVVALPPGFAFS